MPIFINCSRNSDVWSALSAIGTFLAAFIAIFLAYMPRIKRIDLTFIWSAANITLSILTPLWNAPKTPVTARTAGRSDRTERQT